LFDITIKNGNITQQLHNSAVVNQEEKIPSGNIEEEINAISSFSFSIYPNNPCYENLYPYTTLVDVYNTQQNRYAFRGRILKVTPQMDGDGMTYKNVVCESPLAYLHDSVQPYTPVKYYEGDETRTGLQEFIDLILENHNAQVEDEKKIYRGEITVDPFATSDGVYKGLNYEKTWEVITSKLIGSFGGEIDLRESDGLLYLDYKQSFGVTRSTTIELAKNIQSESRDIDPSNIITRLIPLGSKLHDAEGNETEERLTIASVNNNVPYIEDSTALAKYGVIYGVQTWDDISLATNLKTKGEAFLIQNNRIAISDTVTALDLSLLGLDIDDFRLYDSYPVENSLIGVADVLRIVKKSTNVVEPYASSFQLGNTSKGLNDTVVDYESIIHDMQQTESEIRSELKNQNNKVVTYVETKSSEIAQSTESIRLQVAAEHVSKTEYEQFSQTVRNILAMDENGTTMLFNTINEAIAEVDGKTESNYSNILKYIRFEDGNIILGEQGNEITLTISNDRITFMQNGVEVAHLSDNNLYIGNAIIKAGGRLQLGNFAFVPRSDGSLSFLKVGG